MAKSKKAASSSSTYGKKKIAISNAKKPASKQTKILNNKKVKTISERIEKMNTGFELLIQECQNALNQLTAA